MKKIAILTGLLMAMVAAAPLHASLSGDNPFRPDLVGFGADIATSPIIGFDADGDLIPARNNMQDIGETTRTFKTGYFQQISADNGIASFHETFITISSGDPMGLRDSTFIISTQTLMTSASTYYDHDIKQSSSAPRNLTIYASSACTSSFGLGVRSGTHTLLGSCTVYGYNALGIFTQELISFSTGAVKKSTATGAGLCSTLDCDTNLGLGVGNVAWAYISSITINMSSMSSQVGANVSVVLGWGNKIGFANNITNSLDVYKFVTTRSTQQAVVEFDVSDRLLNPGLGIDTTYDTWVPQNFVGQGQPFDNYRSYDIWYRMRKSVP